jgi:hypothetical protein
MKNSIMIIRISFFLKWENTLKPLRIAKLYSKLTTTIKQMVPGNAQIAKPDTQSIHQSPRSCSLAPTLEMVAVTLKDAHYEFMATHRFITKNTIIFNILRC